MREYIFHAELAVLLGETLFVHGQIIGNQFPSSQVLGANEEDVAWAVGVVPDEADLEPDVKLWTTKLNAWARRQVEEWESRPVWDKLPCEPTYEAWSCRGGAELIAYGTPATRVPTVVYCRYLTDRAMSAGLVR